MKISIFCLDEHLVFVQEDVEGSSVKVIRVWNFGQLGRFGRWNRHAVIIITTSHEKETENQQIIISIVGHNKGFMNTIYCAV